jgi:serine/threonine-protein kinase HipA
MDKANSATRPNDQTKPVGAMKNQRPSHGLALDVFLMDRVPRLHVGRLIQQGHEIWFEYASAFLETDIELSPFALPLRPGVHQESTRVFRGLHGLFQDSLPDGWGLRLMDREFARRGIEPATVTPIQRLRFMGSRAMGALTYEPAERFALDNEPLELDTVAAQAERIYNGSPETVLQALVVAGGSPGGARPKILVAYNPDTHAMYSGTDDIPPGFQAYLIKFPTQEDGDDIGAVEMAYADMARDAGLVIPPTRLFTTASGRRCFGVERFDRVMGTRRHVHSLGGLLQVSHREFGCTYSEYLRTTIRLTHDNEQGYEAFRRMIFNVLSYNRDDHVKNFAFLMQPSGTWELAPAYDLVYSSGPAGEHSMMVGSEGARPTYRNFLEVADIAGIPSGAVQRITERILDATARWREYAYRYDVKEETIMKIEEAMNRARRDAG